MRQWIHAIKVIMKHGFRKGKRVLESEAAKARMQAKRMAKLGATLDTLVDKLEKIAAKNNKL